MIFLTVNKNHAQRRAESLVNASGISTWLSERDLEMVGYFDWQGTCLLDHLIVVDEILPDADNDVPF